MPSPCWPGGDGDQRGEGGSQGASCVEAFPRPYTPGVRRPSQRPRSCKAEAQILHKRTTGTPYASSTFLCQGGGGKDHCPRSARTLRATPAPRGSAHCVCTVRVMGVSYRVCRRRRCTGPVCGIGRGPPAPQTVCPGIVTECRALCPAVGVCPPGGMLHRVATSLGIGGSCADFVQFRGPQPWSPHFH